MNWVKNIFSRNKSKDLIEVKFLDKSELRDLPPIPEYIIAECETLKKNLDSLNENPFDKLDRVYGFLNTYGEFAKTFSVCGNGCSSCCKSDVLITTLEAKYIEKKVDVKTKKYTGATANHSSNCPFLSNESCSIYEYRPFNCRTLYTLDDPKYCETGENHQLYGLQGGKGIPLLYQFKKYVGVLNQKRPVADIRDFFS
ncbi:MAG: YkgJ family cysteine cluster protein [Candidatus Oceanisphaera merdipullorum]|nr:YkgJ family cysteine cluster protein [Candidatus Oceanisphaera merdipullorum]